MSAESTLAVVEKDISYLVQIAKVVSIFYPPAAMVVTGGGVAMEVVEAARKFALLVEGHRTGTATPEMAEEARAALALVQDQMFAAHSPS